MDLSPQHIRWILIYVFVLLISVALHEFGHAIMAHKLGDDTPSRQGRVTLNPLAHADPIGTLLLPLIGGLYGGGFGWGKPVIWQPHRVTRKISMSAAKILVAVAGPGMNLVLASTIACIHALLISLHVLTSEGAAVGIRAILFGQTEHLQMTRDAEISAIVFFAVLTNFILFFFNLIPVPPLDGGHVAQSFMPYRYRDQFDRVAKYSPFLLLGVILIPEIQVVFSWPATHLAVHLYQLLGVL